jgi:hypothetical protein
MAERGIVVSHTTIMRWVLRYVPEYERRSTRAQRCAPMLGLTSFRSAAITLAGIELAHRIRKQQCSVPMGEGGQVRSLKDSWAAALRDSDVAVHGAGDRSSPMHQIEERAPEGKARTRASTGRSVTAARVSLGAVCIRCFTRRVASTGATSTGTATSGRRFR